MVGWTLSNLSAVIGGLSTSGPSRVRLVRYERFVAEPQATLDGITDWIGLERSPAIADGVADGFRPAHQIDGNRVRNQPVVRIDPEVGRSAPLGGPTGWLIRRWARVVDRLILRRVTELTPSSSPSAAPVAA